MAPMIAAGTGAGGLGTGIARWAMLCVWGAGLVQSAVLADPDQTATVVLLAAAAVYELVATILVTERGARVLGNVTAAVAAAFAAASAAFMLAAVSTAGSWTLDYASYLAALLIARGSVRAGAIAGASIIGLALAFGVARDDLGSAIASLGLPVVALLIGALWRVGLGYVVRREGAHRTEEARATVATAAAEAAAAGYRAQLDRIRGEVVPLLERISRGGTLTDAELLELQVAEGAIRDRLRSPRVDDDTLTTALAAARRRGVRVSLLWAEGPGEPPEAALVTALAGMLDDTRDGSVVIRTTDPHSQVTVVRSGSGDAATSRIVLDPRGSVLAVL